MDKENNERTCVWWTETRFHIVAGTSTKCTTLEGRSPASNLSLPSFHSAETTAKKEIPIQGHGH